MLISGFILFHSTQRSTTQSLLIAKKLPQSTVRSTCTTCAAAHFILDLLYSSPRRKYKTADVCSLELPQPSVWSMWPSSKLTLEMIFSVPHSKDHTKSWLIAKNYRNHPYSQHDVDANFIMDLLFSISYRIKQGVVVDSPANSSHPHGQRDLHTVNVLWLQALFLFCYVPFHTETTTTSSSCKPYFWFIFIPHWKIIT